MQTILPLPLNARGKLIAKITALAFILMGSLHTKMVHAAPPLTKRISQFSNQQVNVWQTTIYPTSTKSLPMHRHDYDRIVVALTDGLLKVTDDQGKNHALKLKKGQSYFLKKDPPHTLHRDENLSQHAVKVVVIELKSKKIDKKNPY